MKLSMNRSFKTALKAMEEGSGHVFITGKAGTGKSTLLDYFRQNTDKKVAVLAPTGVAAINVKGQTIHSFCKFGPRITYDEVKKLKSGTALYKKLNIIIIDEISMVRADLLDCIDKFFRLNGRDKKQPFGGIKMIFIGDLYQLPPVVMPNERHIFNSDYNSEYFFDANVFSDELFDIQTIELSKIYRQAEQKFVKILNAIRDNSITDLQLNNLNKRHYPNFFVADDEFYIYLTPTNKAAKMINDYKLNWLKAKAFGYQGIVSGDFDKKYLQTETQLILKIGAQVMLLNNDQAKRWVNGSIGKITEIIKQPGTADIVKIELNNGDIIKVTPHTWEVFKTFYNHNTGQIEKEVTGSFTQYPIKLAWAVTIHKSQGKTFDKVVIDLNTGTFAHGQLYVALTRCTSLKGLVLRTKINKNHIIVDDRIKKFTLEQSGSEPE